MHADPLLRSQAATLLARLGAESQRPEIDILSDAYWAERVAAGVFGMGDDGGRYGDERPQFDCVIARSYALARLPVTNRQYHVFTETVAG